VITTILVGTLSLFMFFLSIRLHSLQRQHDRLELAFLRLLEVVKRHSAGDFGP
jgi:hypothetical protein